MNNKILSICIPTYNRRKFLERCINYLLEQDLSDVEVIVSDNCSPDDTQEYMTDLSKSHPDIIYVRQEVNVGPDKNFTYLLNRAEGKYAILLSDDDFFEIGELTKLIQELKANDFCIGVLNKKDSFIDVIRDSTRIQDLTNRYFPEDNVSTFIIEVNVWLTFCSGLIFNTKYLAMVKDKNKYCNTNLVQTHIVMEMLGYDRRTAILGGVSVTAEADNSGGYNVFNVFVNNWHEVLFNTGYKLSKLPKRALVEAYNKTLREMIYPFVSRAARGMELGFGKEGMKKILIKKIRFRGSHKSILVAFAPKFMLRR